MRNYILILCTAAALLQSACYGDKGSYDYKDINEVVFNDFPTSMSVLFKSDVLTIKPDLTFTIDRDEGNYEYEWIVVDNQITNPTRTTLSTEKDLEYFVELNPGPYTLYLKIRDKKTGVLWMSYTSLTVRTQVGRGWLLIGEDEDGYTDVNMVSMATDTVVLTKMLSGLPPLRGPKFIEHTGGGRTGYPIRILIATEDGSYYINTQTFDGDPDFNFRNMVYTTFDMPARLDPVHMISKVRTGAVNTSRAVVCSNGDAFFVSLMNGELYSNPVNRVSADMTKLFRVFPFIFSAPGYLNGLVFYDTENSRFTSMGTLASNVTALSDAAGDVFPWIQPEGRTLVYGENTMNTDGGSSYGNSFALMKDASGYYIYKLYAISSAAKRGYWAIDPAIAANLNQAKLFAFSSTRSLMLYAVGSTLYAYDYVTNKLYSEDMGDEISMINFDILANTTYNVLYVATYNNTDKGTLQKYTVEADPNKFEITPDENARWSGLVKIVDTDWRIYDL